ncbi:25S rRNA (adenine645-N1)-methyltransferase [Podila epigama]|nr:25S rRNA (adenine645-N1)-methyltransferase [Podila epigama]
MFSIPGFNVGNLVVEAPKEQLKKRKHEEKALSSSAVTSTSASNIAPVKSTSTLTSTLPATTPAVASTTTSTSTSNAPFSKKFKKDPVYEKKAPSEPKLGWGWIPEPVPLKERATWNQSTKAMRKAKAEAEKTRKEKAVQDKKALVSSISAPATAVQLLLNGAVDMKDIVGLGSKGKKELKYDSGDGKEQDTDMPDANGEDETPKKRNKRLERKIKKAAYIAAMEAKENTKASTDAATTSTTAVHDEEVTAQDTEDSSVAVKKQQPAASVNPVLAKLTNKEKRLLKQLQKKQKEDGIDPTIKPVTTPDTTSRPKSDKPKKEKKQAQKVEESGPLNPSNKRLKGQSATDQKTLSDLQTATAAAEEAIHADIVSESKKGKKGKKADEKITSEVKGQQEQHQEQHEQKSKQKKDKADTTLSKKQLQLAKERERLLEALSRTNNALEELQKSFGDEEDETPMTKAEVKLATQGKKQKKEAIAAAKPAAAQVSTPVKKTVQAAPAPQPKLTKLQEQMKKTLAGGKFRFLNEQLYTTTGEEAFDLFQSKPELFDEYHEGFRAQVESWPQNPVDIFTSQLRPMPKDTVIADLGCGDAQIAAELSKHNVLSFDLVAKNERVTACDIAHLPLKDASVDVAIFCLSLMGTDFLKFLKEAYRVLKPNGQLKIAEVISRFTDVDAFVDALKAIGFELRHSDSSNKMFIMFDFVKPDPTLTSSKSKKGKKGKSAKKSNKFEDDGDVDMGSIDDEVGPTLLKPCIYKKR